MDAVKTDEQLTAEGIAPPEDEDQNTEGGASDNDGIPETGDNVSVSMVIMAAAIGIIGFAACAILYRKKRIN